MSDIFVNYRNDDDPSTAAFIDDKLCERLGVDRVFRDNRSIELGEDFRPRLWGTLAKSTVLVVVIGRKWLARDAHGQRRIDDPSDYVRQEIAWALRIGLSVVPVLVEGAPDIKSADLPHEIAAIAHRQYRRLRNRGLHRDVQTLVDDIARIVAQGTRPAPVRPVPEADLSGWLGQETTVVMLRPQDVDQADRSVLEAQLDGVAEAVSLAAADAGLRHVGITRQPFRLTCFVPAPEAPVGVVSGFLSSLETALTVVATTAGTGPLRVTVGVHRGTLGAGAVDPRDVLTGLLAQPATAAVRRRATRAGLVLVVPDEFYIDVVRAHPEAVDPATYLPVDDRDGTHRYWMHVPGYSAPPGLPAQPRQGPSPAAGRSGTAGPGPTAAVHNCGPVNYGTVNGSQISGPVTVQGDWVNGSKNVYGDVPGHR